MAGASSQPAMERRSFLEIRTDAPRRRIEGYAARFGIEARIGNFTETIARGAFAASLASDILGLLDHDPGKVLGRTRSGTLRLAEDDKGLEFSLDLPDTQAGRDVLALAERNDLGGMSFGFLVPKGGDSWAGTRRMLQRVDLKEISVVQSHPAYEGTEIALRSRQADLEAEARRRRLVMAELGVWA